FVASTTTGWLGSRTTSITGALSGALADATTTPLAGVRAASAWRTIGASAFDGRRTIFVGTSLVGPLSASAAHSLLQYETTLPARTPTAGARSGSTGLPQTGQLLMATTAPRPPRTERSVGRRTRARDRVARSPRRARRQSE